jgi:hypothetical protein
MSERLKSVEDQGIDPCASCMLSTRSTIWARLPRWYAVHFISSLGNFTQSTCEYSYEFNKHWIHMSLVPSSIPVEFNLGIIISWESTRKWNLSG